MSRTQFAKQLRHIMNLAIQGRSAGIPSHQLGDLHAQARLTRREALKRAGGLAGVAAAAGVFGQDMLAEQLYRAVRSVHGGDPVVILGAGTAGLTAAYRLTKAGVPCVVYEAAKRVGGRMYTQHNFNSEGMFC